MSSIASLHGALDRPSLACLVAAWAVLFPVPSSAATTPRPVSPGAASGVVSEARCPTFSWAGAPEARGYELAVFRISGDPSGGDPVLVTRASLPAHAQSWTPPLDQCLERGERYAWSVAAAPGGAVHPDTELDWATVYRFEVARAPSSEEVERAMATLHGYLEEMGRGASRGRQEPANPGRVEAAPSTGEASAPRGGDGADGAASLVLPRRALTASTSGVVRAASAATAPTLGTPSLGVSANLSLGAASNVFKDGDALLWDDTSANTAFGRRALDSVSGIAAFNTAVGSDALTATTGETGFDGTRNTAIGDRALQSNTTGFTNTAVGFTALSTNQSGLGNTAVGAYAMHFKTGSYNTAIGYLAGRFGSGSNNILINNQGEPGSESHVLRIGSSTGTLVFSLQKAFIHGIRGGLDPDDDPLQVMIDQNGQLHTLSSSRETKQDIADLGPLADRLLALRPVSFRYRWQAEADPEAAVQYGLIAEEVAEVFPELVAYGENGRPATVKYHLLTTLLLGELQRQDEELRSLGAQIDAMTEAPREGKTKRGSR